VTALCLPARVLGYSTPGHADESSPDSALGVRDKIGSTGIGVDTSYAAPQAHGIVNISLHREYPPGIVFIFSQGRKDLYHV
jgi:hypothetical protein